MYFISCSDCGKQYIGETGRYIAERVLEHRTHTVKGNVSGSALAEPAWDSGHDIDWDSGKIVDKENHWKKRKHSESFYICQRQPSPNSDKWTLPSTYSALFYSKKTS